jgi:anti-sigma factor RsiW
MHDCRETQANLFEVIFDEADGATRTRLLAETERCAACAAHYRSLSATLDACDVASAALAPVESYWPRYHASLARRLRDDAAGEAHPARPASSRAPFGKRLLTTSIRVPAPLAAAAALLLIATSVYTLTLAARPAPEPVVLAAPGAASLSPPESAPQQIKFIEVPVVREKIVTQIIYLPRRGDGGDGDNARRNARRLAPRENLAGVGRHANNAPPATTANAATPRTNLSDFKPAGEVNLRIIKGSDAREK